RQQLAKSLEQAAAAALTPAPLGVSEITIAAAPGRLDAVANEVASIAQQLGGSATKGIPEQHHLGLLVDLPAFREMEFQAAISAITGGAPSSASPLPLPNETAGPGSGQKSFAVQIVESPLPQNCSRIVRPDDAMIAITFALLADSSVFVALVRYT